MQTVEALKLVAMLVAAYPSWKPTEETQRLYAGFLEQVDYDAAREVLREIIESPREFVPPVGLIISRARERMRIAERDRQLAVPRKYVLGEVGTIRKVDDTWLTQRAICASNNRASQRKS